MSLTARILGMECSAPKYYGCDAAAVRQIQRWLCYMHNTMIEQKEAADSILCTQGHGGTPKHSAQALRMWCKTVQGVQGYLHASLAAPSAQPR